MLNWFRRMLVGKSWFRFVVLVLIHFLIDIPFVNFGLGIPVGFGATIVLTGMLFVWWVVLMRYRDTWSKRFAAETLGTKV